MLTENRIEFLGTVNIGIDDGAQFIGSSKLKRYIMP